MTECWNTCLVLVPVDWHGSVHPYRTDCPEARRFDISGVVAMQCCDDVRELCLMYLTRVCFTEFIEGVSQFSVRGDKDSKLRCK